MFRLRILNGFRLFFVLEVYIKSQGEFKLGPVKLNLYQDQIESIHFLSNIHNKIWIPYRPVKFICIIFLYEYLTK
jgi:hypothetical protein